MSGTDNRMHTVKIFMELCCVGILMVIVYTYKINRTKTFLLKNGGAIHPLPHMSSWHSG
jgi:hypothetical protein